MLILGAGLNGLDGLNVTDAKLIQPKEKDGTNMRGNVFIPNPSVMTIAMVGPHTHIHPNMTSPVL